MGRKKINVDMILAQVVELFRRHHPSKLNFSKVSRFTGVARPTLYYYFGGSFETLLVESIRFGLKRYTQLSSLERAAKGQKQPFKDWRSFQEARLRISIAMMRRYPWISHLYFRHRNDPSPLSKAIYSIEERYIADFEDVWKLYKKTEKIDPTAARVASYIKLGLLWGMSSHWDYWFKKTNHETRVLLAKQLAKILEEVMAMQFVTKPNGKAEKAPRAQKAK